MIDAASLLPPAGNLTLFNELGADLVAISGGKGVFRVRSPRGFSRAAPTSSKRLEYRLRPTSMSGEV